METFRNKADVDAMKRSRPLCMNMLEQTCKQTHNHAHTHTHIHRQPLPFADYTHTHTHAHIDTCTQTYTHLCCNGVSVDLWLVADVASTVSVAQRVERLLKVDVCWADAGNHDGPAVASQRILCT